MHGGLSPRGIASASYKHGKYSQLLPPGLRKKYGQTATEFDEQLLTHRNEIRLIDVQLAEWASSLKDDQDNTDAWAKILVATETRRRLVESEGKVMVASGRMISKDDAQAFIKNTCDLFREVVTRRVDEATAHEILAEVGEGILRNMELMQAHESRL
jgi:hypothetical protein